MKSALQRTQLSDLKLKMKLPKVADVLKLKHLVSIGFSGSVFYEHFNRQSTYAVFFYFQNCKISLSKKIFHQHFVGFLPYFEQLLWEHFICHYISTKNKKNKPPLTL